VCVFGYVIIDFVDFSFSKMDRAGKQIALLDSHGAEFYHRLRAHKLGSVQVLKITN